MKDRIKSTEAYAELVSEYEKDFIRELVATHPWRDFNVWAPYSVDYDANTKAAKGLRRLYGKKGDDDSFTEECDICEKATKNIETRLRKIWGIK